MIVENSLNPNCSEAVVRFGSKASLVDTASTEALEKFADEILPMVMGWKKDRWLTYAEAKKERLVFYDNLGGGASIETIARLCRAVIDKVYKGKNFDAEDLWFKEDDFGEVPIQEGAEW